MVTLWADSILYIGLNNNEMMQLKKDKKFILDLDAGEFLTQCQFDSIEKICISYGNTNEDIANDLNKLFDSDVSSTADSTSEKYIE